ncbi:hypothetical protein [Colwellia psychrerythraea]|uniref:Uncharacterized protein n=1 Tax=Colwellia psychrerythraea TaxID=28229 RepID=A0A099KW68_COLPS|nr:hypothetical protein [Colwellia psychrerythraea]KGJ94826.1 hypothetical protein GAB14E_2060 [Colwellia psychrerythraea]
MKKIINLSLSALLLLFFSLTAMAYEESSQNNVESTDRLELKTSFIKGNKELPQVLYIVPWQEIQKTTLKPENMVLHSLYGDIFQPVTPEDLIE